MAFNQYSGKIPVLYRCIICFLALIPNAIHYRLKIDLLWKLFTYRILCMCVSVEGEKIYLFSFFPLFSGCFRISIFFVTKRVNVEVYSVTDVHENCRTHRLNCEHYFFF